MGDVSDFEAGPDRPDTTGCVLVLTVGLPRSGKSTWARSTGMPVVNPDAVRCALHGRRYYEPAEPFVWATARLMVRSLFYAGHKAVVLDATGTTRARRDEWKSKEWTTKFRVFDVPAAECVRRATELGDEYIVPVIERMAAAFEPPGGDEAPFFGGGVL